MTLTDGAGEELDEQKALLNLPMKAAPRARPNIINAAGIVPWAFEEPPGVNCAVWQLSKHLELTLEEVQADMQRLFQSLHPEETTFSSPRPWSWRGARINDHATSISPTSCTPRNAWTATPVASHSLGQTNICGYSNLDLQVCT